MIEAAGELSFGGASIISPSPLPKNRRWRPSRLILPTRVVAVVLRVARCRPLTVRRAARRPSSVAAAPSDSASGALVLAPARSAGLRPVREAITAAAVASMFDAAAAGEPSSRASITLSSPPLENRRRRPSRLIFLTRVATPLRTSMRRSRRLVVRAADPQANAAANARTAARPSLRHPRGQGEADDGAPANLEQPRPLFGSANAPPIVSAIATVANLRPPISHPRACNVLNRLVVIAKLGLHALCN